MRVIIGCAFLVVSSPSFAATYCVNSNAEESDALAETNKGNCPDDDLAVGNSCSTDASGLCTLREAIHAANARSGADHIAFNLPAAEHTIGLLTTALTVTDEIHIDGYTQSGSAVATVGAAATLVVVVQGSGGSFVGIELSAGAGPDTGASHSSVSGLVLESFSSAVSLDADHCTLAGNYIGTDATGLLLTATSANTTGIAIAGSTNTIGGTTPANRNVIAGNATTGIDVSGASNLIEGNYIGLAASGTAALLNSPGVTPTAGNLYGVRIATAADATQIGAVGAGNVIAANESYEIFVNGTNTQIVGNFIGVSRSGNAPASGTLDFGSIGVDFQGAGSGTLGGTAAGEPNVIAGHGPAQGILLDTTSANITVSGNLVGLDLDQSVDSNVYGINVSGQTSGTIVLSHNLISGNGEGVRVDSATDVQMINNLIGTDITGAIKKGNAGRGVSVLGGSNVGIGDSNINHANVISGNGAAGVYVHNAAVTIAHNYIGLGADGSAIGNTLQGIDDDSSLTTTITGNLISANTAAGILVANGKPTITQNYIGLTLNGQAASGNVIGILVSGSSGAFTIGGSGGNTISGNQGDGIKIDNVAGVSVYGNIIGADVSGTLDVGNTGAGVEIVSVDAQIGDASAGKGNVIAFNQGSGIVSSTNAQAIIILDNAIFGNAPMGIDLGGHGATLPLGTANVLDYPSISAASGAGSSISVSGTLGSLAAQNVGLQFFATPSCDTTGFGQAKMIFASDTENSGGPGTFSVTSSSDVPDGYALTAIATLFSGPFGGASTPSPQRSSEISSCFTLAKIGTFSWLSTSVVVDGSLTTAPLTIQRNDGTLGAVSIDLATHDGTAQQGVDYSAASETVDFPDGVTQQNISLSLLQASHPGTSVSFTVALSNPQGGAALLLANAIATVTITDAASASTGGSSGGSSGVTSGGATTGGSTGAASGGVVNATSGGSTSTGGAAATTTNVGKKGCGCGAAPSEGEWLMLLMLSAWLFRRRSA